MLLAWYPLSSAAVQAAYRYVGTRETGGQNRGSVVEMMQRRVGIPIGSSWCMALVYTSFDEAAGTLSMPNPLVRTGGCLDHWYRAKAEVRLPVEGLDIAGLHRGAIFIIDHGVDTATGFHKGHAGLITDYDPASQTFATIEGNTNAGGSRNGDGVYIRQRALADINVGFLDYSRLGDPARYAQPLPAVT